MVGSGIRRSLVVSIARSRTTGMSLAARSCKRSSVYAAFSSGARMTSLPVCRGASPAGRGPVVKPVERRPQPRFLKLSAPIVSCFNIAGPLAGTDEGEISMSAEARLKELGFVLPSVPTPVANYVPFRLAGNLLFLSGQGPRDEKGATLTGKVGKDVTVEEAYRR